MKNILAREYLKLVRKNEYPKREYSESEIQFFGRNVQGFRESVAHFLEITTGLRPLKTDPSFEELFKFYKAPKSADVPAVFRAATYFIRALSSYLSAVPKSLREAEERQDPAFAERAKSAESLFLQHFTINAP